MLRTPTAPAQPTIATSGSLERLPHLRGEVGVDDLGVLVDEDQRLEVVAVRLVEQQVVVAEQEPTARRAMISESGSAASSIPGERMTLVDLVLGDGAAEGDHRRRAQPFTGDALPASVNELSIGTEGLPG